MKNAAASRRVFLQSAAGALMVAANARQTGAADAPAEAAAAVPRPGLELALTVTARIDPPIEMGTTPLGKRRVITISGGSFEGPGVKGIIMPGGEDWQVDRADGVTIFDARYWLRTHDDVLIKVTNRALADRASQYLRTSPEFEAPAGAYDWLNKAIFVGTLSLGGPPPSVILRFYKVT